jgi:carboxyl-terminal processing protease
MSKTDRRKHTRRHLMALAAVALVPVAAGGFVLRGNGADDGARIFQDVMSLVASRSVEQVSPDSLYEHAARGLLRSIGDPYAELFSPQELAEFSRENLRGEYGGLGVLIEQQDDYVTVTKVYPHTPAEEGGVQAGDKIIAIGGQDARGWKIDQASDKLMGPAGTDVEVTLQRYGVREPIRMRFTRRLVHVPAVPYGVMLEGNVGYVPLQRFSNTSGEETQAAILDLKRRGARSFILDLRGNGGGSVNQSVQVSNLFLPRGEEIASVRYRNQPEDKYVADKDPVLGSEPVVVMVDGNSASASEIVAGALQDHDRAVVLGTTSFGKGLVQDLFRLDGGWALKLTTGKWYTPSGRSIQRERKLLPDGRLVEVHPDSALTDSAKKARPVFRSDAGRPVYGGGGVTPDVSIKPDTLSRREQEFMATVAPKAQPLYLALQRYAVELRPQVTPGFTVRPEWRDEFYRRITAAGVQVRRSQYDSVAPLVDRILEERIATTAFGDSASFRRSVKEDPQLLRALALLRGAQTQREVFARASAAQPAQVVATARQR